jgi:large subunit ribosomal protein L9
MRVLLLKNVEHVGPRGDMVEVSDGYARNYLIPRKLATLATSGVTAFAERLKKAETSRREQEGAQLKEFAERLSAASCTLVRKSGEDGKLFGSVTPADVAAALGTQGFEVDRRKIEMGEPIKSLGVYTVSARLSAEHVASVKVWVVREAEKAG